MLIFKKAQTKFIRLYNQNHCVVFYLNTQSIETHCSEEVFKSSGKWITDANFHTNTKIQGCKFSKKLHY